MQNNRMETIVLTGPASPVDQNLDIDRVIPLVDSGTSASAKDTMSLVRKAETLGTPRSALVYCFVSDYGERCKPAPWTFDGSRTFKVRHIEAVRLGEGTPNYQ